MKKGPAWLHGDTPHLADTWYTIWNRAHYGKASRDLSGRNHRTYRRWTLESRRSRATFPRHETVLRTEAWHCRDHATNACAATPRPTVHGNHRAYGVSRQAAACGIRDYASRKIPAAVARRNVPLGQVALGCHGTKKAPGFRSAAISPSCWTTATSV